MLKHLAWLCGLFLLLLAPLQAQEPTPTPFPPRDLPTQVGLWELFQLRFEVPGSFSNPYDPDEVSVTAIFNAPDGTLYEIPAFFMQPYDSTAQAVGSPEWRVRFTPTQAGEWRYSVEVRAGERRDLLFDGERFTVIPTEHPGFIGVSQNQRYFSFENGVPYFPIGQNLGWSWEGGGGLASYLEWLDKLAQNGANYARIFVDTAWFIGLEWQRPAGDYSNAQLQAWWMDQILEAATQRGIYLQVVLIWHQAFIQSPGLPVNPPTEVPRPNTQVDFDSHAYNQANGGPLSRPESLFANTLVKDLLKQKLRYMLGRWGYSPQIFAWEVITDVDRLPAYNATEHLSFINELTSYVRDLDPYPHLVTVGSRTPLPELINNDLLDFAQVRFFERRPVEEAGDQVSDLLTILYDPLFRVNKPLLLTEFSLNPWFEPTADDPGGIHLQTTLWAAALSSTGGGGMSQWWDTYIDRQNLYSFYTPLSRFSAGIEWGNLALQPVQVGLVDTRSSTYQPLRIENFNRNFRGASPPNTVYTLTADGAIPSTSLLSSYLYGSGFNAQASFPQTLIVAPSIDTTLSIGIRDVAPNGNAMLVISLDDQPYASLNLTEGSENTQINIPLTAGQHRLVLDNIGRDWVELSYLEIAHYVAPLRALALADTAEGIALVWLHNRQYTWQNAGQPLEIQRFILNLYSMPPGTYQIEFWDTATGNVVGQERVTLNTAGTLTIPLVPIQTTLAVRAIRIEQPEGVLAAATTQPTRTPFLQPTPTASYTFTASPTLTITPTLTVTNSPTSSPTATFTPSITPSSTPTETPSSTATPPPSATLPPTATQEATSNPTTILAPTTEADSLLPRATRTPRPSGTPR